MRIKFFPRTGINDLSYNPPPGKCFVDWAFTDLGNAVLRSRALGVNPRGLLAETIYPHHCSRCERHISMKITGVPEEK
jgi:hypothetical protein